MPVTLSGSVSVLYVKVRTVYPSERILYKRPVKQCDSNFSVISLLYGSTDILKILDLLTYAYVQYNPVMHRTPYNQTINVLYIALLYISAVS